MKMTLKGQLKECATAILYANRMKLAGLNFRYNLNYFGTKMRKIMEGVREEGLDIPGATLKLVARAEKVLKEECDGKDCSYQKAGRVYAGDNVIGLSDQEEE